MKPTYRRLPHIYIIGRPLFITYRLHGSLPPGRHFDRKSLTSGRAFFHLDEFLDSESCGPLYLKMPNIAARLKGASALQANQQLGLLHKPFWQTES